MSRYVSESDIVPSIMGATILAQLTQDDPDAATADADVLASWIVEAEAEVDAYLGRLYALPLATVPALITRLAARIVRYKAYTSRPGEVEAWLTKDYEQVQALLVKIGKREVELGLTAAGADATPSQAAGKKILTTSSAPVFGRANLKGF